MIKTCKVIWKNELFAVVDYNGTRVQIPSHCLSGDEITLKKKGVSFYIINEGIDIDESNTEEESNVNSSVDQSADEYINDDEIDENA